MPPFGSSDQLSYAAYGRMLVTGHNPYTTTPAQLAALGDPVARAVQDWFTSSSVYGPLATGVQGLAALIGGTSARLTVFVLGLANLAAFAGTALLLHRMTRRDPVRQLRAALLWTANPLLLQLLIAGAHVDGQAVVFGVAAVAVFFGPWAGEHAPVPAPARAALAGVLAGLGFAVKVTDVLVGLGLAIALCCRLRPAGRRLLPPLAALAAGFAVTAGAALAIGGPAMLAPAVAGEQLVSIGSPWRVIRTRHPPGRGRDGRHRHRQGRRRRARGGARRAADPRAALRRATRGAGRGVRGGPGLAVRLAVRAALVRRAGLGAAAAGRPRARPPGTVAGCCSRGPPRSASGTCPPGRPDAALPPRAGLAAAGGQARRDPGRPGRRRSIWLIGPACSARELTGPAGTRGDR